MLVLIIFSGVQISIKCVPIHLFCYKRVNINIHIIPYKEIKTFSILKLVIQNSIDKPELCDGHYFT